MNIVRKLRPRRSRTALAAGAAVSLILAAAGTSGAASAASSPTLSIISGYGGILVGYGEPAADIDLDPNEGVAVGSSGDIYVASTEDNVVGEIDAPSTFKDMTLPNALGPTGQLSWSVALLGGTPGPSTVDSTTEDGVSAVNWKMSDPEANTWLQSTPSLIAGVKYTASVKVVGSGTIFLDFYNGSTDLQSASVTLSSTPQTLSISGTVTSSGTPQFQLRTPSAQSSLDVTAWDASLVGTDYTGATSVVAGDTDTGYSGNGGQADKAKLDYPGGVAVTSSGVVYVADTENNVVRKVATDGVITTVAGTGKAGYSGNGGQATKAKLDAPQGLAVNSAGDLFIADANSNVIREVKPDGIITTVAGTGTAGSKGDGGKATGAELDAPQGVAVNSAGDLFIADTGNNRIQEVDTSGIISIVAGNGTFGYSGDGGKATKAELGAPYGVAVDDAGDLFIADTWNNRIREVTDGTINTVVGNGDGDDAAGTGTDAELDAPYDVAYDPTTGNLYAVTDGGAVDEITGAAAAAKPATTRSDRA